MKIKTHQGPGAPWDGCVIAWPMRQGEAMEYEQFPSTSNLLPSCVIKTQGWTQPNCKEPSHEGHEKGERGNGLAKARCATPQRLWSAKRSWTRSLIGCNEDNARY
jgi:hypothetical protein